MGWASHRPGSKTGGCEDEEQGLKADLEFAETAHGASPTGSRLFTALKDGLVHVGPSEASSQRGAEGDTARTALQERAEHSRLGQPPPQLAAAQRLRALLPPNTRTEADAEAVT